MFERATLTDQDALLALMRDFYQEDQLLFDAAMAAPALECLLKDASRGDVFLLREREKIAGYFVVTRGFSLEFGGDFLLLDELYLKPSLRGQGLAGKILDFVNERARQAGCAFVRLEVHTANERAMHIYRRAGFSGDERLLLSRRLDSEG